MAKNSMKKTIDTWADVAIDDPVRRIWFICIGAVLLVGGTMMALLSHGNQTEYVSTFDPNTGSSNFSVQGPSVFAVLIYYIGIMAAVVGILMAIAIGIRLHTRWTDGGRSLSRPATAAGAAPASTWTPGPGPTPTAPSAARHTSRRHRTSRPG